MSGKRINLRRGVGKSAPIVEEGDSAFAKAAKANVETSRRAGWGDILDGVISSEAMAQVLSAVRLVTPLVGGATGGRISSSSPETQELPRAHVYDSVLVGVDPAAPGQERTVITVRQALEDRGYRVDTRTADRYAPTLEVNRRYQDMTTDISLRIYLRGPNSPPSYCVASFRDEEFIHLHGTHQQTLEIREEIVRRLLNAVDGEMRSMLIRALEETTRNDEWFRREVWRITGGGR